MTDQDDPYRVNTDIERRIAAVEEPDLRQFLEGIIEHERENLPLEQPDYTTKYRTLAEPHLEGEPSSTAEHQDHE
jgi:hypothetical protein